MANGHGGRRPGAGRPKGSASKRTREIADRACEEGKTPLEIMLDVMREAYGAHDLPAALEAAKAAAPYVHPRLAAVEMDAKVTHAHEDWLAQLDSDALPEAPIDPEGTREISGDEDDDGLAGLRSEDA